MRTMTSLMVSILALAAVPGVAQTDPIPACDPADERMFADVPADHVFCGVIEEMARLGITAGCGGENYCPGSQVSRAQMAAFITKALLTVPEDPFAVTDGLDGITFSHGVLDLEHVDVGHYEIFFDRVVIGCAVVATPTGFQHRSVTTAMHVQSVEFKTFGGPGLANTPLHVILRCPDGPE